MIFANMTPIPSLLGGTLIGAAASLFLLSHGKTAGISGLYGDLLRKPERGTLPGAFFLAGLALTGALIHRIMPSSFEEVHASSVLLALGAGALVGFGTRLGSGCTSGHGVCGISSGRVRSIVATVTFMALGFVTVYVTRHLLGRAS